MALHYERVIVESPVAEPVEAELVKCECGCPSFIIFHIGGDRHPHYQCFACGVSYCVGGSQCQAGSEDEAEE